MKFNRLVFLSVFCAASVTLFAADDSKVVALSDTPPAVQKTIQAQLGNGKLGDIEKDSGDGETTYDVDLTTDSGRERGFTVAEDGTLLSVEIEWAETPAVVQKTIQSQAAGYGLESIDKNLDDSEVSYDVEVTKDGHEKDFSVAGDGTLLSLEVTLAETPAAVQKMIQTQIGAGTLQSVSKVFDDGEISYDVEAVSKGGQEKSFNVTDDGRLASEQVVLSTLSPGARRMIAEKIGDGKLLRIDKSLIEKRNGVLPYEVEGRKDGKPFDFSVGPKGRFLGMDD